MAAQNRVNQVTFERLKFLDKMVNTLLEAIEDHEKIIQEQANQIEKLQNQMNELLKKA